MAARKSFICATNVEALELRLEKLSERASGEGAQAVLLRMIERARQTSALT